jgi:excisionase family DNA binding protein
MAYDHNILTVKELCDLLRLHPITVYRLARQNKIPRFRVGNEWRFRRDLLERWMTEQTMNAQRVIKIIEAGAHGKARHRRRATLRKPKH